MARNVLPWIAAIAITFSQLPACAQRPQPVSAPVDAATRSRVIDATVRAMTDRYVFADAGRRAAEALAQARDAGRFDGLDDSAAFAERVTALLRESTKDLHLRLRYSERELPAGDDAPPTAEELAWQQRQSASVNFGIERVERLPGNIGYIDLRNFHRLAWAAPALSAAMNLVAHTDALIVDLRQNGGGDPEAVAYMISYLVDERTHLNDMWWRDGGRTEQFWTQDAPPGARFGGRKPVYVLVSKRTFSGAEEFAYNMKALKRGTVVGETTGGGAHPGDVVRVAAHFGVFVPTGRAINPVTKTNWEGTGVEPDVKVPADDALAEAQRRALAPLIAAETDGRRRDAMRRRLDELGKGKGAE